MAADIINGRIKLKHDTTQNWNNAQGFIPLEGEIIIYDDYQTRTWTVEEYGEVVTKTAYVPGIKIGSGNGYVQDLPFITDELRDRLLEHIDNLDLHTSLGEKTFWSNKINIDDIVDIAEGRLENDTLIFNRN